MIRSGLRLLCKLDNNSGSMCKNYRKLSNFQVAKFTHEFDHVYDRNKDGFIDKIDISELKRTLDKYHVHYTGNTTSPEYLRQMRRFEDFWILFTEFSDANRDGLISRDEWLDIWEQIHKKAKGMAFESLPMWIRLMPSAIFPIIDTKKDGHIDYDEYRNFWFHVVGEHNIEYSKTKSMFDLMTNDGRDPIDFKKFKDLYADYYLSNDINTPGKYIVGPVLFTW